MVVYLIEDVYGKLMVTDFEYIDPYYHFTSMRGTFPSDLLDWDIWREDCPQVKASQAGDAWWLEWTEESEEDGGIGWCRIDHTEARIVATYDTQTQELRLLQEPGEAVKWIMGLV